MADPSLADQINRLWRTVNAHRARALWNWGMKYPRHRFEALRAWAQRRGLAALERHDPARAAKFFRMRDEYAAKKKRWIENHPDPDPPAPTSTLVNFDGKQVPRWMVEQALAPARASGVWKGGVFSGVRSKAYSISICIGICGAPFCSGLCAGASSNHACPPTYRGVRYEGAVDVTDPAGLQRWCRAHGNPIRGNGELLPRDLPHFSRVGN